MPLHVLWVIRWSLQDTFVALSIPSLNVVHCCCTQAWTALFAEFCLVLNIWEEMSKRCHFCRCKKGSWLNSWRWLGPEHCPDITVLSNVLGLGTLTPASLVCVSHDSCHWRIFSLMSFVLSVWHLDWQVSHTLLVINVGLIQLVFAKSKLLEEFGGRATFMEGRGQMTFWVETCPGPSHRWNCKRLKYHLVYS